MGVPVILATAAACGSLVTSVKSGWELSRMIRLKRDRKHATEYARQVHRGLRRSLHNGRMSHEEYHHWLDKLLVAETKRNLADLRKISAHLRIVDDNGGKESRRHGSQSSENFRGSYSGKQQHRHHNDDKPLKSVRFDMGRTCYVPGPPQSFEEVGWPHSAGSIEYYPLRDAIPPHGEKGEPDVAPLPRLQRRATVTYQPAHIPPKPGTGKSDSSKRYENERGRSQRQEVREARRDADDGHPDGSYHKKLGYRSKR